LHCGCAKHIHSTQRIAFDSRYFKHLVLKMSFKNFIVNYLSPFYFLARLFFAFWAAMCWFIIPEMASAMGLDRSLALLAFRGLSLVLAWNALRPWKIGASYNDIKSGLDNLQSKLK
jgi:hypothetical protein